MKSSICYLDVSESEAQVMKVELGGGSEELCRVTLPPGFDLHQCQIQLVCDKLFIALPSPPNRVPFFYVDQANRTTRQIKPIPGTGGVGPVICDAHACGILTVIGLNSVWLWDIQNSAWNEVKLPTDFVGHDAAFHNSELVIAGSWKAAVGRPRAGVIRYRQDAWEQIEINLRASDAAQLKHYEADECFYKIVAINDYLFLLSDCAWFIDDPISFLTSCFEMRWSLTYSKIVPIQNVVPGLTGIPRVILESGDIMSIDPSRGYLRRHASVPCNTEQIISSYAKDEFWALASSTFERKHSKLMSLYYSCDFGDTFEIVAEGIEINHIGGVIVLR